MGNTSHMIERKPQAGASIIEFILVAIPVLLIGLGGIELAAWLNMRQTLSMALINAARAASSQYAEPQVIADVFEDSLLMAYPKQTTLKQRLAKNKSDLQLPWQIIIMNPNSDTFMDHKSDSAMITGMDRPYINNYYQDLQHIKNLQRGKLNGKGEKSGTDIFQANTLQLELTWPLQPILPGIQQLIRLSSFAISPKHSSNSPSNYHDIVFTAGYIPLKRNISISMQSHPVLWASLSDGRVIYSDDNYFNRAGSRLNQAGNISCNSKYNYLNCTQQIPNTNNTGNNTGSGVSATNNKPDDFNIPGANTGMKPADKPDPETADLCDLAI